MRKKIFIAVVGIIGVLSIATLAVSQMDRSIKDDLFTQIELFSYALTTVKTEYVDDIKPKDLIYGSLRGLLSSLDPHSQFMDPEEYKELKTETEGKFGGLGIEISVKDGLLTIITPIEDTPAWRAGVKAGDRIVKIGDELTRDMTLNDAVKRLRGEPNTKVTITVLRESDSKILEFTITREIIHIQDVKNVQILKDKIGYIRLTEFREESAKEFRKGIEQLKAQGADSLILDLRNNPGGLLNVAIDITEQFLPEGQTIVSTKGRRESQNSVAISANKDHVIDWPTVVMINQGSASGSEILAGALKDNKRAVLLGTKSFGKGSVQSVIPMPDGSGLRLTTAKYFTPSGVSIHEKGIIPDVVVDRIYPKKDDEDTKKKDPNEKDVDEVFDNVKKNTKTAVPVPETDPVKKHEAEVKEELLKDNQIQSAINVLNGIKVYKKFEPEVKR
ncbi:MAG: S41 family peptidase [Candidatus Omnitrophica bacterium]|nr:S41 family peptidase [Candidatus Omnitrophota bacterium]